jgi:hypothetical protein
VKCRTKLSFPLIGEDIPAFLMRYTNSNAKNDIVIFDSTVKKLQIKSKIDSFVMFGFYKEKRKQMNNIAYKV